MHQRAHLVYVLGRILYISTTNAPSVLSSLSRLCAVMTQRLIVPLFTSPRALESLFTDCEISSVWFPRAGATLMTESRSLPCSAPCHQSRGVAETHSLTPPRSHLSRPSVYDKHALEYDIHVFLLHPSCSKNKRVLTDSVV